MQKFQTNFLLLILIALFPFFIPTNLNAQTYTLEVVVNHETLFLSQHGAIPFDDFGSPVSLDTGENEVFFGIADSQKGIYTSVGTDPDSFAVIVADENTAIPMGSGNFTDFGDPVSLGGGEIVFKGFGSGGQRGIYKTMGGTLALVADLSTPVPGGSGNFTDFFGDPVSLGGGEVVFVGFGSGGQRGIYKTMGGILAVVADLSTPNPGGSGTIWDFADPISLGGGDVAFKGNGSGGRGIYKIVGGTLALVADLSTPVPGGSGNFIYIDTPISLGGGVVAFRAFGSGGQEGLYKTMGGALDIVADFSTQIPGRSSNFDIAIHPISLGGGDVAFIGGSFSSVETAGIYKSIGGTLALVADHSTPVPGDTGNFTSLRHPVSLGGGDVAFFAFGSSGQQGIYTSIGGILDVVADKNTATPMDGGDFIAFDEPVSLGGADIAFRGVSNGNRIGIYNALTDLGSIKIVKETIPGGATGFEFTGTNFPAACLLDGTFTLDDGGFKECNLPAGTYTVQETNSQGFAITDIDCTGAVSFSETADSITIDLMDNENVVCTFTNTDQFALNINLAGDGVGNVSAPGIDCGDGSSDCMETYLFGTGITLVATPDAVSTFTGFTGDPDCTDGVVTMDSNKTCTATFEFLPLILNPIFPGIQNNLNTIPVSNATPGGSVAYIWGFQPGSFTLSGATCNGIELGIKPVNLLGITNAEPDGTAEFEMFIPMNPVFQQAPLLIQAVDIDTCRTSPVVPNTIQNN